jgi:hypothetical protein
MMILAFKFHYVSHNGVLENFLYRSLQAHALPFSFMRQESVLMVYVKGGEEALLSFSTHLAEALPLSIYFKSLHVEVVEAMEGESTPPAACEVALPFTPWMVRQAQSEAHYFNPFVTPDVGIDLGMKSPLVFTCKEEHYTSDTIAYAELFTHVAKEVNMGSGLHVKTSTGYYRLNKLDEAQFKTSAKMLIVPCDLSVVEKMVVIKENEIKALASLEKPILRLPVNAIFAQKSDNAPRFVQMKMADDLVLYLLCVKLFEQGVAFVSLVPCEEDSLPSLTFEGGAFRKSIGISVLENGEMVPWLGDAYASPALKQSVSAFDSSAHGQFAALLKEHQLFQASTAGVYLSVKHDDAIMVYQETHGMLELIHLALPESIGALLDQICEKSETGAKLVQNYATAYPDTVAFARTVSLRNTPRNLATVMGIAGVLFGFGKSLEAARDYMLENALLFSGLKGPRIDYLLEGESLRSSFNVARIIRSGLSYKLADLDDLTLSFGYVDSLGYFISDTLDRMKEEFNTTHVGLCGGLFANKRLCELAARQAGTSHTVCFNRELPIDT